MPDVTPAEKGDIEGPVDGLAASLGITGYEFEARDLTTDAAWDDVYAFYNQQAAGVVAILGISNARE
ncbi:MAG: hypothetical protein GYA17_11860 [Chloroflexi bacterium]|nr:hypothetical protein [Anaerolineaceae bacterium]NMB89047.1 hypothetical protein [Chloroflexota bacterium]